MGLIELLLAELLINMNTTTDSEHGIINFNVVSVEEIRKEELLLFNVLEEELKGIHLKIGTVQNDALSSAVETDTILVGSGVAFDLVNLLQKKYKFHYSIVLPEKNELGTDHSGIFGLINNNQVDLGAAFLPMTMTRNFSNIHFALALDVGEWVTVLKRRSHSANGAGLMEPFEFKVWLLILISLLVVGPIMYLFVLLQRKLFNNEKEKPISLTNCLYFLFGALMKQGTTLSPISDSTRLLFATWWIFITILTAFYTANLTAFLTLSTFTLPIKNPSDIRAYNFPWVALSGSIIEDASTNPLTGLYGILKDTKGEFLQSTSNRVDILEKWVYQKDYLYIAERPNIDVILYENYINKSKNGVPESKRCTFVVTPWAILKSPRGFVYSKTFKFAKLFDSTLRDLFETGFVKHSTNKKLPNVNICPLNLGNIEKRLRNTDLLLTYYIVAMGFLIAFTIFTLEIITIWLIKIKRNRDNIQVTVQRLPPPPSYEELFLLDCSHKKKLKFNGRDYWVLKSVNGDCTTLIPVQRPSAILYQYTN